MTNLALAGNWDEARELHYRILPLMEVNFIESSPGPVKAAMAIGFARREISVCRWCRLPTRVATQSGK
jgi:dihydrodipicolinate synthase/N-acetylneuraminate lyase